MYVPEHFVAADADALVTRLARRHAAILFSTDSKGAPFASHLPILWDSERHVASGHIARANPHHGLGAGIGVMVVAGAEAYVSPSYYPSKAEHGKAVPTWNYEAVHLTGRIEWFDDRDRLLGLVRDLSVFHERDRAEPWAIEDAPAAYIEAMLRGIIGVELHAERIEAKQKLSQNKSGADYHGVADGLQQEEGAASREVADLMRRFKL
jgi:transcriptional regulator